jgi:hypothetical protein
VVTLREVENKINFGKSGHIYKIFVSTKTQFRWNVVSKNISLKKTEA